VRRRGERAYRSGAEPLEGERAEALVGPWRRKWPSGPKEGEEGRSPFFKISKAIFKWILNSFLSFQIDHTIQK
jgi:hypothetical protein